MGTLTKAIFATTLGLGATLAFATDEQKARPLDPTAGVGAKPTFEQLDGNRDGAISKDEVPATHALSAQFASLDTNNDQRLSRAEFAAYGVDEEDAE